MNVWISWSTQFIICTLHIIHETSYISFIFSPSKSQMWDNVLINIKSEIQHDKLHTWGSVTLARKDKCVKPVCKCVCHPPHSSQLNFITLQWLGHPNNTTSKSNHTVIPMSSKQVVQWTASWTEHAVNWYGYFSMVKIKKTVLRTYWNILQTGSHKCLFSYYTAKYAAVNYLSVWDYITCSHIFGKVCWFCVCVCVCVCACVRACVRV